MDSTRPPEWEEVRPTFLRLFRRRGVYVRGALAASPGAAARLVLALGDERDVLDPRGAERVHGRRQGRKIPAGCGEIPIPEPFHSRHVPNHTAKREVLGVRWR